MSVFPLSDLSLSLSLQRQSRDIRSALQDAGYEMTTGQSADIKAATSGAVEDIFGIDRSLTLLARQDQGLTIAAGRAAVMQSSLEIAQNAGEQVGLRLSASVSLGDLQAADNHARAAGEALATVIGALNTNYGGTHLFSGAAEGTQPLASAATIIADITALIDAAPDAGTALTDVEAYFNDPGGAFETTIYRGAVEDAPGVLTPDGDKVEFGIRADAQEFRDLMRGLAIAASFESTTFANNTADKTAVFTHASRVITLAKDDVIDIRATLGVDEQSIANAQAYIATQTTSLQFARQEAVGVDQFEAAARFADLENQLNSAYTVTARISNLTLTNFLR